MKKLLFKTAMVVGAMLLGMTLQAQEFQPYHVSTIYNPTGTVDPNMEFLNSSSFQEFDQSIMREQVRKATAKAESQMYTITLNLEYDSELPESLEVTPVAYFTDDSSIVGMAFSSDENVLQGQLPSGTYNIITSFRTQDLAQQYFVIKENVEVTGDMNFTINPAEATNHITTKIYGPNGEVLKHGLCHFDEATNSYIVDQPGDTYYSHVGNTLYQKGVGSLYGFAISTSGELLDEEQRTIPTDFYINDVSDRFVFIQRRTAFTEDLSKSYCTWVSTDNLCTCEIENNPNDYVCQEYNYKYTPYGRGHDDGIKVMNGFWLINDEHTTYETSGVSKRMEKQGDSFPLEVWINVQEIDPNIPGLNILVQTLFPDFGEVEQFQWGDLVLEMFTATGWTFGTPIRVKNGQKEFVNFGHTAFGQYWNNNNLYYSMNNTTFFEKLLPAPSAFTYPSEQAIGDFGDNCPINAVNVTTYENDDQMRTAWTSYFVGRYGEVLYAGMGSTMTLKYNGEEVDLSTFSPSGKGTWEVNITNPNVEVDGLPGHNTTTVYFDQNQEDMTPPSIEMLHFKNGDGGVTDRFATAEEGTMEFYASDFNYVYYPELWNGVFECQPMEMTVEYAPYGTENWNELTVEEIPEFYQEPGWGYFYRGSLAEVTGQSEKGWFDLKFHFTDASGNWQEQVVSPAFRIDNLAYSSVATIGSGNAHEVARYSIDGKHVDASHQGVTIVKMSDGTARKVLVK